MRGRETGEKPTRIDAAAEWRSRLTGVTGGVLLFEIVTGLIIFFAPFGALPQFSLLAHTIIGLAMVAPIVWYVVRHWRVRRRGNLSHYQVLGYAAAVLLGACLVSGIVVTWQGITGPRLSRAWDTIHLVTGMTVVVLIVVHLLTVIWRKVKNAESRARLKAARGAFYRRTVLLAAIPLLLTIGWVALHESPQRFRAFPPSYNWSFGEDRPFAPSLARLDHSSCEADVRSRVLNIVGTQYRDAFDASFAANKREPIGLSERVRRCMEDINVDDATRSRVEAILADSEQYIRQHGAADAEQLAGSARCGTCHNEIYEEWLPSAHRYASMDILFQEVQSMMAVETSPEATRYCAGCHDPISLFSGAKNSDNVTLSVLGADEGISCVVCHSIVQTDVQGNADFTIQPPTRYAYELSDGAVGKYVSDFLIRTYPEHHVSSYSRPLYKTPEFCGACHKQYVDKEVNTDIGKVQGQNQYDSWKNSRWYHGDLSAKTISCRECHMPLNPSVDPARGDATDDNRSLWDGKHRSHRTLGANQYIPILQQLEGAEEHVRLTEQWLRGEYEIPEIAHKWTTGPVVRLHVNAPKAVAPGETVPLQITLTNNKTGHDFPTGPLDMIESWIELQVTDDNGEVIYHVGGLDEAGYVVASPVVFKADGFDREGELIDRHNLWDLVGASYKRSMYPGVTDAFDVQFQCPSMARGRLMQSDGRTAPGERRDEHAFDAPDDERTLHVEVKLWYRKANPEFLDRVFGVTEQVRSPATCISTAQATIRVSANGQAGAE